MITTNRIIPAGYHVKFGENILTPVNCAKFLGVNIDNQLNFKSHVHDLNSKLSRNLGIMKRMSYLLPQKTLLSLYFSLIHCHISYALTVWGNSGKTNITKISNTLNRAINLINFRNFQADVLNFEQTLKIANLIQFHKILHNQNQQYFRDELSKYQVDYDYSTRFRASSSYYLPFYRKSKCQNSFLFRAVGEYNELPSALKNITSSKKFKKEIKKYTARS